MACSCAQTSSVSDLLSSTWGVASGGITRRGFRSPWSVSDKKPDDRGLGPFHQQLERSADHVVRRFAAQQLDAELVEQQQLLRPAASRTRPASALGSTSGRPTGWFLMTVSVSRPSELRGERRRLVRLVKLELGGADAHVVAVGQHGVVDLLVVDERAVAAARQSRMCQTPLSCTTMAWTREHSGSPSAIVHSGSRPMRFSSVGSSRKLTPARLPTVIVR